MPRLELLLNAADRARLESGSESMRIRFRAGRTALLTAAARFTGVEPRTLTIDATCPDCGRSHGRPRVVGAPAPVHISLTHAGGRAIAVASAVPVGVDAETRAALRAQRAGVRLVAPASGAESLRHWTRVEAVVKADGRGLRIDPRSVFVTARRGAVTDSSARYRIGALRPVRGLVVSIAQEIVAPGRGGSGA